MGITKTKEEKRIYNKYKRYFESDKIMSDTIVKNYKRDVDNYVKFHSNQKADETINKSIDKRSNARA